MSAAPARSRAWALGLSTAFIVAGCEDEGPGPGRPPTPTSVVDSSDVAFEDVKRPRRTYFAENDEGSCTAYWEQSDHRSKRATIRCPRELEPGERMRLAGSGCLRESALPGRAVPIRCVKTLFYMRDADRSAGKEYPEYHLAPE